VVGRSRPERLRDERLLGRAWLAAAVAIGLLAAGVPSRSPAAERPAALQGVRRIVALGDSITEGGGEPGGYVWLLERYLRALYPKPRITIANAGVGGQRAPDMAARFRRDVLDRKPQLVTINVGINDVWHAFRDFRTGRDHPAGDLPAGVPLPVYRAHLEAMTRAARAARIRVVLLSPTVIYEDLAGPENTRLAHYVEAMRAAARQEAVTFVDLNTPFREVIATYQRRAGPGQNLLTTDGVHLNAAGHRLVARAVLLGLGVSEAELAAVRVADEP
jgi:acyl-CoA thioesterase I